MINPNGARPAGPPPFPVEVLPEPAADYVRMLAETGLPLDFLGMSALGILAGAVGGRASLLIDPTWRERPIVWLVMLGDQGSMKSPSLEAVRRPLDAYQEKLSTDYEAQWADFAELPKAKQAPSLKPVEGRVLMGDTTQEALIRTLHENEPGVLLLADEIRALIAGLGEFKNKGQAADRARLLALWAGLPVTVDRVTATERHLTVRRPTLSIVGGLQPELLGVLAADNDGLIERFLISHPAPSPPPNRVGRKMPDLERVRKVTESWGKLVHQLCELRRDWRGYVLEPDARDRFNYCHDELMSALKDPDEAEAVKTWTYKAPSHLGRLAALLEAAHNPRNTGSSCGPGTVDRAWKLTRYFRDHRRTLVMRQPNWMLPSYARDVDRGVDSLYAKIRRQPDHCLTRREITRAGIGGIRTKEEADALISRYEKVHPDTVGREIRGGQETVVVYEPGYRPTP